jgi:hypothetical protein
VPSWDPGVWGVEEEEEGSRRQTMPPMTFVSEIEASVQRITRDRFVGVRERMLW